MTKPTVTAEAKTLLAEMFEKRLPSALFSKYEIDEFERREWAVYFKPSEWRAIVARLAALEKSSEEAARVKAQLSAIVNAWGTMIEKRRQERELHGDSAEYFRLLYRCEGLEIAAKIALTTPPQTERDEK